MYRIVDFFLMQNILASASDVFICILQHVSAAFDTHTKQEMMIKGVTGGVRFSIGDVKVYMYIYTCVCLYLYLFAYKLVCVYI